MSSKARKDPRPICRLCGHAHWSNESHVFDKEPAVKKTRQKKPAKKIKRKSTPADVARVKAWRKKNPEKYKQYQRDLMAKRRAEAT